MAFQFPWTNFHELNLDWFLSKFKQFTDNYLGTTATVELIPTTEQPEVTVTGGTLDDDTDIVDPFTFNFKLPINSSGGGAVDSVNGKVGDVVLDKTDIGLGNVDNVQQYSTTNPPPYPVTSVNGQTGDVVLDKTDIGLGNVDNVQQYSATNPPPYPVTSVNGMTGDIIVPDNYAPAIITTANGAIAHFTDGADDLPISELIVSIAPSQSGSGDPSPSNIRPISGWTGCNMTRTGKNLLNLDREVGTPIPSDGANTTSPRVMDTSHYYVGLRPDNFYYPSNIAEYSVTNNSVFIRGRNNAYGIGFPVPVMANTTYTVRGVASANPYLGVGHYDAQWNYLSFNSADNQSSLTFTTPANCAYSVIILRSTDTTNGTTWTHLQLALGSTATTVSLSWQTEVGTVYGGTLDMRTGLLTVTNGYIASYNGETLPSTWISDRDVYSSGTTPTTGAQVVYVLATPQTYQLTPQQLFNTLYGDNNVWSDTGDSTVTYTADTMLYIQNLTQPTEDDMVANTAIANGKFFMIGNNLYRATTDIAIGSQIIPGTNAAPMSLADALNLL